MDPSAALTLARAKWFIEGPRKAMKTIYQRRLVVPCSWVATLTLIFAMFVYIPPPSDRPSQPSLSP